MRERYNNQHETSTSDQDGAAPSGPPPEASGSFSDSDKPGDSLAAEPSAREPALEAPESQPVGSSSSQSNQNQGSRWPSSQASPSGLQQQVMFAAGLAAASEVLPDSDSILEPESELKSPAAAQLDARSRQESLPLLPTPSPNTSEAVQLSHGGDGNAANTQEQDRQEPSSDGPSAPGGDAGSQEGTASGQAHTGPQLCQSPLEQVDARGWTDSSDEAPSQSNSEWAPRQASGADSLADTQSQLEANANSAQQDQDRAGQVPLFAAWQHDVDRGDGQSDQPSSEEQGWGASAWQDESHAPDASDAHVPSVQPSAAAEEALPPLEVDQMSFEERLQAGRDCFRYAPYSLVHDTCQLLPYALPFTTLTCQESTDAAT